MALLQISEPGKSTNPHEHRLAVGIDLGTTNSLIATIRSGEATVLPDEEGRSLLPSVVRFRAEGSPQIGYPALDASINDPMNTIASAKRMIGRKTADIKSLRDQLPYKFDDESANVPRIITADGPRSAIEVSAEILTALKKRAETSLRGNLGGVVITVPAYFDDALFNMQPIHKNSRIFISLPWSPGLLVSIYEISYRLIPAWAAAA